MIFAGQPSEDVVLGLGEFGFAFGGLGGKDAGIGDGKLFGFDHAIKQFRRGRFDRRLAFFALVHNSALL